MSLIYDALRQQSGSAAAEPAAAPRASWWRRQSAQRRNGLLLAAGALIAMPLTFLAAGQIARPSETAPAPSAGIVAADNAGLEGSVAAAADDIAAQPGAAIPVISETPAPDAMDTALPALPAAERHTTDLPPVAAPAPLAPLQPPVETPVHAVADATAGAPATIAAPSPVQAPAPAPMTAVVQTQEEPQPIRIKVERRGEGGKTAASAPDDQSVQSVISGIETAVADGDNARARLALTELESLLPSNSLTLLRMQAWVAHRDGDMASAEQLYRRIAERVPDDENAGVNIALLSAHRGDIDDARQRLTRLAGRHGRSVLVARALADIEAQAR